MCSPLSRQVGEHLRQRFENVDCARQGFVPDFPARQGGFQTGHLIFLGTHKAKPSEEHVHEIGKVVRSNGNV